MTIQAWGLLKKLKKAQLCLDGYIGIDTDKMKVITIHEYGQKHKSVSVKKYEKSWESTLRFLREQGYIRYDNVHCMQVTYVGWYFGSATALEITKLVLLNVVLPVVVSVIAAIITTKLMIGG